jgi:hypothetical protein
VSPMDHVVAFILSVLVLRRLTHVVLMMVVLFLHVIILSIVLNFFGVPCFWKAYLCTISAMVDHHPCTLAALSGTVVSSCSLVNVNAENKFVNFD